MPKPRKPDLKDLEDGWRGCIEEPTGKAASPQLLTLGFPVPEHTSMPCRDVPISHPAAIRKFQVCWAQNLYMRHPLRTNAEGRCCVLIPAEGQAGASSQGADGEEENAGGSQVANNSLSQEARLESPSGDMSSTLESKRTKGPADSGDGETAADGDPEQQQQSQHQVAAKCACCALM